MWDWYLGQAGFGEQIQAYGDTLWRQAWSISLVISAVIVVVLLFIAVTMILVGRPETERRGVAASETRASESPAGPARTQPAQTEGQNQRAA
jgi:hypothetical protein